MAVNDQKQAEQNEATARAVSTGVDTGGKPGSAAEKSVRADTSTGTENTPGVDFDVNPYPNYHLMPVETLQELAEKRKVRIPRDVLKAHLITALQAADTRSDI